MGREIWTEVRDKDNKVLWSSADEDEYFCGRTDATTIIAQHCYNRDSTEFSFTDKAVYDRVVTALKKISDEDTKAYNDCMDLMADAREARRHAATLDAFNDFTDLYDSTKNHLENIYWQEADDIILAMEHALKKTREIAQSRGLSDTDLDVFWVLSE